jgi:hypothetical protein
MTGIHGQAKSNNVEPVRLFYVRVNLTIPLDEYNYREIGITYYLLNWEEGLKANELETAVIQRLRPRYNSVIKLEE